MRETLTAWGLDACIDTVQLAASELITNAVLHTASGPGVALHRSEDMLRLEVTDDSPVEPARKSYGPDAATGRGLLMIETLASDWGSIPTPSDGKTVWCNFDIPHLSDLDSCCSESV